MTFHLVLVTKYKNKCLNSKLRDRLHIIFNTLLEKWDCELIEFNGDEDHVHLLMEINPTVQPSKLINNLKTVSSRYLRKEFTVHLEQYYWKPVLWSRAYCLLSTGGATLETIRKYIESQGRKNSPSK